jgi:hypothetical protein
LCNRTVGTVVLNFTQYNKQNMSMALVNYQIRHQTCPVSQFQSGTNPRQGVIAYNTVPLTYSLGLSPSINITAASAGNPTNFTTVTGGTVGLTAGSEIIISGATAPWGAPKPDGGTNINGHNVVDAVASLTDFSILYDTTGITGTLQGTVTFKIMGSAATPHTTLSIQGDDTRSLAVGGTAWYFPLPAVGDTIQITTIKFPPLSVQSGGGKQFEPSEHYCESSVNSAARFRDVVGPGTLTCMLTNDPRVNNQVVLTLHRTAPIPSSLSDATARVRLMRK